MKSRFVASATSITSGLAISYQGRSVLRGGAPSTKLTGRPNSVQAADLTVVAPAEYGSFGDEGLVLGSAEACSSTGATMKLLAPGATEPWVAQGLSSVTSESGQLNPLGLTWKKLRPATASGKALSVIGADSIDAVYGVRTVSRRVSLLNDWNRCGGLASLVNFSMKETPSINALRLLRKLDSEVSLWARDVNSQRRAESFLERKVHVAPDIAMFMPGRPDESVSGAIERIYGSREENSPVVGLVVNAHFDSWSDQLSMPLSEYFKNMVTPFIEQGILVVLIAHDIRDWPGDIQLIEDMVKAVGPHPYLHSVVPSSALAAKALISHLDLCITARMHAGVAALSSAVPAIGLDYVDKFKGQFEWYGAQDNVIPWIQAVDVSLVTEMADKLLSNLDSERAQLSANVAQIRSQVPAWVPRV